MSTCSERRLRLSASMHSCAARNWMAKSRAIVPIGIVAAIAVWISARAATSPASFSLCAQPLASRAAAARLIPLFPHSSCDKALMHMQLLTPASAHCHERHLHLMKEL